MANIDYDKISDEDFMKLIDNIDEIDEDESNTNENDIEDTDQHLNNTDNELEESETNHGDDDFFADTDDDSEEAEGEDDGENSQDNVGEESNSEPAEKTNSDEESSAKEEPGSEEQSNADTEGMTKQEKIDYQEAYEKALKESERYKKFYNEVTSEFVANGKVMKGFDDPKKIIQAQQMAAGFSDKMKAFKQYRPFINPLREKGIIDNPDKFNLMLNALDGDKEAIKKIIQEAEIDPTELDMENIDYKPTNQLASDIEVAFEDVIGTAEQYGVRDRVEQVVGKDWDDNSVIELLEDPQNSADLVNHLSTGVYDLVQQKIAEKKMTDPYGVYSNKRAIDQYREAAQELESEYLTYIEQEQKRLASEGVAFDANGHPVRDNGYGKAQSEPHFSEEEIQAEINRIKQEQEYASRVEKRNAEADKGRRKAASVSKRKPRSKKKEITFDPGKMSDEEFTEFLDSMILS